MKNLLNKINKEIIEKQKWYYVCGCDACHWEAYDLFLFYFFKDWDVENPKWKFCWRKDKCFRFITLTILTLVLGQ